MYLNNVYYTIHNKNGLIYKGDDHHNSVVFSDIGMLMAFEHNVKSLQQCHDKASDHVIFYA